MAKTKILYVCQEIYPYLPESEIATLCRALPGAMQERGCEIRTFMPRYGVINERRNQLHEVIRLSGMNLIIDDNDHQLIIKVASIPAARVQIYFIDNDDYFSRKAVLRNTATGEWFADNDERALFFARGVLETVRKLRWQPDVIHCHGWFAAVAPLYVRYAFADDPLFRNTRVVCSLYADRFEGNLTDQFRSMLAGEGIDEKKLDLLSTPSYENLMKLVIDNADGIVIESSDVDSALTDYVKQSGRKVLDVSDKTKDEYLDNYRKFYEELV